MQGFPGGTLVVCFNKALRCSFISFIKCTTTKWRFTLKNLIHHLAYLLVTIGAINWGLVGLLDMNLVTMLLHSWPVAVKAVYLLIGAAGLLGIFFEAKRHTHM